MNRYSINQHSIVLNLDSVSVKKVLVTEFIISQNLNFMWNMSTQWNQQVK